jgi:VWFA-related protein
MRLLSLLVVAAAAVMTAAPQGDVVFRSGVSLVRLDVEAVDTNGRVVPGLTKDDFRVLDNGVAQLPGNFSFAEEPLDLILLFDTSGSMRGKLFSVVRATELGFHELRTGDRASVWTFNDESMEVLPFTENLQSVNEAILLRVGESGFRGGSKAEDAATEAARRFQMEPKTHRKRAIVIVTNKPGTHAANEAAAVRELWNADAVVSELILSGAPQTKLEAGAHALVDRTGGASIMAGNPGEAFRDAVHYVRSGYTMYYAMPDASAGTERRVQVELTPEAARRLPNVRIRARSGYIVPPA